MSVLCSINNYSKTHDSHNKCSLLRRGSKGLFFRVDPLSNVSAGTELQATAESAGASARYHTQDGRHPGETIFSELLSGVA